MAEAVFNGWKQGVVTSVREDKLAPDQLLKADNVDLLPGGYVRRRKGFTKLLGDGVYSSLVSAFGKLYFRKDGMLCSTEDFSSVVEHMEFGDFSHTMFNSELVLSDMRSVVAVLENGEVKPFGQVGPSRQPDLQPVEDQGGLFQGQYQVAITYVGPSGQESGTHRASTVFVPESGGIRLVNIPQSPYAEWIRIYVSDPNGENLYFREAIPAGTVEHVQGYRKGRKKLRTQFLDVLPAGRYLASYRGRVYTSVGNTLVFTDPLNTGMYKTIENYIVFKGEIQGLAATNNGIFVSDDSCVSYLSGASPDQMSRVIASNRACQKGTMTTVEGEYIADSFAGQQVVVWWASDGHMVAGLPDGSTTLIRGKQVSVPSYEEGGIFPVVSEGTHQLVSVLKNPHTDSASSFGDSAEIEVHRNGISL